MGMQTMPRARRRLTGYDVNEISLVRVPDIDRKIAVLKSAEHEDGGDDDCVSDDTVEQMVEVLKSATNGRVPPMDAMGNIVEDPNALDSDTQQTLQNIARQLAPIKDRVTQQDLIQVATQLGLASMPQSSMGINDADYADDDEDPDLTPPEDDDSEDDSFGDDPDQSDEDVSQEDDDDDEDEASDNDGMDMPPQPDDASQANAKAAVNQAKPPSKSPTGNVTAEKHPAVKPEDHADATAQAQRAYLDTIQKKGYKLSSTKNPQEDKNPMADKSTVNKSAFDWTKANFTPAQREQMEPIFKSVQDAHSENARLNEENKQLVQKSAALADRLDAIERDTELKQLVQKTAEYRHLDDHAGLAAIAMSIPAGEQRDKYLASLEAQNNRYEKVVKSAGVDPTREIGSSAPGREPAAANRWESLVKEQIEKSADKGGMDEAAASQAMLSTQAGREAYAEYRAGLLSNRVL